jgi:hypothetical protein
MVEGRSELSGPGLLLNEAKAEEAGLLPPVLPGFSRKDWMMGRA